MKINVNPVYSPAYSFDDVLLMPWHSEIDSRQDVDISTRLGSMKLTLPILSANMDTVTEDNMAIAMARAGGAGVLHRFASLENQSYWLMNMRTDNINPRIISIGLDDTLEDICHLVNEYQVDAVCVDVAHGDHINVIRKIEDLRHAFVRLDIIAGNVATGHGAKRLVDAGANIIKVGIGPGSVCSTRIVSGHGVPQLTAIYTARGWIGNNIGLIADGGIRYPGDIVKALAAGADAVMLGSLLAGTDEAAGTRVVENGVAYKTYRGMASREVQQEKRPGRPPRVEGISAKVPYRGPVLDTLNNLEDGIRSGLSYSGANNIMELRNNAEFIVVTSNTLKENHPHHPYRL